ncbi:hypothetical protein S7711_09227 [Stachybotrys chartarum IBT 7711]|uniref:Uncharacterized protein n=1 Tax=Stachybotrys chartarum (strain CBS 109288 / IBT 7711) TaxID=1280523 RepID=A0A084ALN5_STACB|nr:hypothetical protein S7711_09227 [Stachybotrys chartarum IBT 7711]
MFRPAIDVTRDRNRQHIMLIPNALVDTFLADQPRGSMFWKYPAAGISHAILPLWADLYNYAVLGGNVGIGVWASKEASPDWTAKCLSSALLRSLGASEKSLRRRERAKLLGDKIKARLKRQDVAAGEVAKLAHVRCNCKDTKPHGAFRTQKDIVA